MGLAVSATPHGESTDGRRPTVVLLGAEDALRHDLAELLRDAGFHVLACGDGEEVAKALQAPADALVTDVRMNGATGLDWIDRAHGLAPEAVIIAVTHEPAAESQSLKPPLVQNSEPPLVVDGSPVAHIENLKAAVHDFERRHIAAIVAASGGDKVVAAGRLGIGLSSLYRKLDGRRKTQGG